MKRIFKTLLAVTVVALALFGFAAAGPFEDGQAAYDSGDYAAAMRIWRPMAEQGAAAAQYKLGFVYQHGVGLPRKEYAQALAWYRSAAKQGDAEAQLNLGLMYDFGEGVPKDYAEALTWYRRAAEQGLAEAQANLGAQYEEGRIVPQDYVAAYMWLNLAASASGASDAYWRVNAAFARDNLAAKMTLAQIAEAQRLAREWKPK